MQRLSVRRATHRRNKKKKIKEKGGRGEIEKMQIEVIFIKFSFSVSQISPFLLI